MTGDMNDEWVAERGAVPAALGKNRKRRERAEAELDDARAELRSLLARGALVALDVAEMSRAAGISRETAHRALRAAGVLTFKQKHRMADEAGIPQGPARLAWFQERGL
jgi:hypothetical protein